MHPWTCRSLTRDHKCDLEKQQALLTIRSLIQLTHVSGVPLVAAGVVRAIVALAENGEDKLRYVALETLCELGVFLQYPVFLPLPLLTAKSAI